MWNLKLKEYVEVREYSVRCFQDYVLQLHVLFLHVFISPRCTLANRVRFLFCLQNFLCNSVHLHSVYFFYWRSNHLNEFEWVWNFSILFLRKTRWWLKLFVSLSITTVNKTRCTENWVLNWFRVVVAQTQFDTTYVWKCAGKIIRNLFFHEAHTAHDQNYR